jgi:hypothetical protein
MVIIPMKYQTEAGVLLGELTNGMWITSKGLPIWKNTLANVGVAGIVDYEGPEKIELNDARYNELTQAYFSTLKKPRGL